MNLVFQLDRISTISTRFENLMMTKRSSTYVIIIVQPSPDVSLVLLVISFPSATQNLDVLTALLSTELSNHQP